MTDTTTTAAPIAIDTIVDRVSFVAWRTDWRARYAAASETIRAAKRELVRVRADWRRNAPNASPDSYEYQANSLIENMPWIRRKANALMIERTAATDRRESLFAEAAEAAPVAAIAA
jgi:hypothetical protein